MPLGILQAVQSKPLLVQLATFKTQLGWFGVLHHGLTLFGLKFGFDSRSGLVAQFTQSLDRSGHSAWASQRLVTSFDGFSKSNDHWRQLLVDYAAGKQVCFADVELSDVGRTEFQTRVLNACREIPFGSTVTYGQLAAQAGSTNAARAVGSVMKSNRFPIVIPCHRVTASKCIGGFSAADGTSTKRRLLEMESCFGNQAMPVQ